MAKFFDTLQDKMVAFIGAGVAHRELFRLFVDAGAKVTLCDRRTLDEFGPFGDELLNMGVRMSLGANYLAGLAGQDMILRTPGFDYFTPELQAAEKAGCLVTSEIELFIEYCPAACYGITGSDGKTTTSTLIAAMLKAAGKTVHLGGNIGRAMLPIVDDVQPEDVAVVELSSFQLVSMHQAPGVAVVTNLSPNHLDHHKDMQEYIDAKRNILKYQPEGSLAVLGLENETTRAFEADVKGECRWFSHLRRVNNGAFLDEDGFLCVSAGGDVTPVVHRDEVKLRGTHNLENLLAAFAAVRDAVSVEEMAAVATSFAGVQHRIEPVRTRGGVQWFNDSIATSPTRVMAGLRAFGQRLVLIAGGYDKNIPFQPMAKDIVQRTKLLILMGNAAAKIEQAVRGEAGFAQSGLRILHAENMDEAVRLADENTAEGDVVLLSPACSSFDAYSGFEARGEHFKALVNAL